MNSYFGCQMLEILCAYLTNIISGYGVSKVVSPYHSAAPVYSGYGVSKIVPPVAAYGKYVVQETAIKLSYFN